MLAPKAETKTEGGPPQEVGAEGDKPDGNHRQPRDAAHQPPEHAGAVTDNRDAGPLEPAEQVGGRPPEELTAGQEREGELPDRSRDPRRLRDPSTGRTVLVSDRRQEADDPGGQEVDGHPRDDVVDAQAHGDGGVDQTAEGSTGDPEHDPPPRPEVKSSPGCQPRPEDHHALETDVDDAGPLGEQAPEPRQEDGDGQAQSGAGGGARGETCGPGHQVGDRDDSEHRHDPPPVSLAGSGHGHSSMLAASRASRVSMSPLATS